MPPALIEGGVCVPLTVTPVQRTALLDCCGCHEAISVASALADDLMLPDEHGGYAITTVPRGVLVNFLEHELHLITEFGDWGWLAAWDACVTLLAELGHEVDGSIYGDVACHCPDCVAEDDLRTRCSKAMQAADGDPDEQDRIRQQFYPPKTAGGSA